MRPLILIGVVGGTPTPLAKPLALAFLLSLYSPFYLSHLIYTAEVSGEEDSEDEKELEVEIFANLLAGF